MSEVVRCSWADTADDYREYHDTEWGVQISGDAAFFERLSLEGFQAGLSWITVLRKRPAFREAFADFDPAKVAEFGPADVARLLANPGIIRHRGKIEAVINNSQVLVGLWEREGSGWLESNFRAAAPTEASLVSQGFQRPASTATELPAQTAETKALTGRLRSLGFRFVGPTTLYSTLQATGLVNDHTLDCFRF